MNKPKGSEFTLIRKEQYEALLSELESLKTEIQWMEKEREMLWKTVDQMEGRR